MKKIINPRYFLTPIFSIVYFNENIEHKDLAYRYTFLFGIRIAKYRVKAKSY
jgi:hypothetical protein